MFYLLWLNANCIMLFDSGLDGLVLKLSGRLLGPLINFSSALTYTLQVQLFASGKSCLTRKREKSIHFGPSNVINILSVSLNLLSYYKEVKFPLREEL